MAKRKTTMSARADRHDLYLRSVQEPEAEIRFFDRVYRNEFGKRPHVLREDFCGTAAICWDWVHRRPGRRAIGVDLDPDPIEWGIEHLASNLNNKERSRVELLVQDVRTVNGDKADIVAAENFSYWVFKTRDDLRRYFKAAYRNIGGEGLLVTDLTGGSEAIEENREETTRKRGFSYVWEQARFDPITHHCRFHIHFRFPDGSEIPRAFTYDWRMWSIPEVRELILEAGFDRADVYWEGTERDTGEGNGVYRKAESGAGDPSWVAYVVGVKR